MSGAQGAGGGGPVAGGSTSQASGLQGGAPAPLAYSGSSGIGWGLGSGGASASGPALSLLGPLTSLGGSGALAEIFGQFRGSLPSVESLGLATGPGASLPWITGEMAGPPLRLPKQDSPEGAPLEHGGANGKAGSASTLPIGDAAGTPGPEASQAALRNGEHLGTGEVEARGRRGQSREVGVPGSRGTALANTPLPPPAPHSGPMPAAGLNRMTSADMGLAKQSSFQLSDFGAVADFTLFPGAGSGNLRALVSSGSGAGGLFRGESLMGVLNPPMLRAESYEFSFFGPLAGSGLEDPGKGAGQQGQRNEAAVGVDEKAREQNGAGAGHTRKVATPAGDAEGGLPIERMLSLGQATQQLDEDAQPSRAQKPEEDLGKMVAEGGVSVAVAEDCAESWQGGMLPSAGLSLTVERAGSPLLALGTRKATPPRLGDAEEGAAAAAMGMAERKAGKPLRGKQHGREASPLHDTRPEQSSVLDLRPRSPDPTSLLSSPRNAATKSRGHTPEPRRSPAPVSPRDTARMLQEGVRELQEQLMWKGQAGAQQMERADSGSIEAVVRSSRTALQGGTEVGLAGSASAAVAAAAAQGAADLAASMAAAAMHQTSSTAGVLQQTAGPRRLRSPSPALARGAGGDSNVSLPTATRMATPTLANAVQKATPTGLGGNVSGADASRLPSPVRSGPGLPQPGKTYGFNAAELENLQKLEMLQLQQQQLPLLLQQQQQQKLQLQDPQQQALLQSILQRHLHTQVQGFPAPALGPGALLAQQQEQQAQSQQQQEKLLLLLQQQGQLQQQLQGPVGIEESPSLVAAAARGAAVHSPAASLSQALNLPSEPGALSSVLQQLQRQQQQATQQLPRATPPASPTTSTGLGGGQRAALKDFATAQSNAESAPQTGGVVTVGGMRLSAQQVAALVKSPLGALLDLGEGQTNNVLQILQQQEQVRLKQQQAQEQQQQQQGQSQQVDNKLRMLLQMQQMQQKQQQLLNQHDGQQRQPGQQQDLGSKGTKSGAHFQDNDTQQDTQQPQQKKRKQEQHLPQKPAHQTPLPLQRQLQRQQQQLQLRLEGQGPKEDGNHQTESSQGLRVMGVRSDLSSPDSSLGGGAPQRPGSSSFTRPQGSAANSPLHDPQLAMTGAGMPLNGQEGAIGLELPELDVDEEDEDFEKVPGKPGPRRKKGPVTKPCAAARKRRDCISRHIRTLQELIPSAPKSDAASILAETISYVSQISEQNKRLRQALSERGGHFTEADMGGAHGEANVKDEGENMTLASRGGESMGDRSMGPSASGSLGAKEDGAMEHQDVSTPEAAHV